MNYYEKVHESLLGYLFIILVLFLYIDIYDIYAYFSFIHKRALLPIYFVKYCMLTYANKVIIII